MAEEQATPEVPPITPLSLWLAARSKHFASLGLIFFVLSLFGALIRALTATGAWAWAEAAVASSCAYWAFTAWTQIGKYPGALPSAMGLPFSLRFARTSFNRAVVWSILTAAMLALGLRHPQWAPVLAAYTGPSGLLHLIVDVKEARGSSVESVAAHTSTAVWQLLVTVVLIAYYFMYASG
jgi:hypothetical protein